jgi:hypothetical protein
MKSSVSSLLVIRRSVMTEVIAARQSQFRVDCLNDLTAQLILAAKLT